MKMKKKSMFSKMLALCLALVFALSMSATAFAAITPTDTAKITVNNLEKGTVVTAYQVISVNVDETTGQPLEPMYTWNSEVAKWLKTKTDEGYNAYVGADNAVTETFTQGVDEAFKSFWHDLAAAIANETVVLAPTKVSDEVTEGQTSVELTEMPMGQYLLTANGGVKIYQPTTAVLVPEYDTEWNLADTAVTMKGQAPTIGKDVTTDDDNTVAVGDTVGYKLTVTVPSYPEDASAVKFNVGDTLSTGLTYNNDVKVYSDESLTTEIQPGGDTYQVVDGSKGETFVLQFAKNYVITNAGKTIYVGYSAEVNEQAFGTDSVGNDAFLGYNNDPYDEGSYVPADTHKDIYTYGITLKKVDKEGAGLEGAEFTLTKQDGDAAMKFNGANGVYTYNSKETGTTDKLVVASDGTLQLKGLDVGTYVLKETKAPDGYVIPNGTITIEITDAEPDGTIDAKTVTANGSAKLYGEISIAKNVISFNVQNTNSDDAGFQLPTTGGMGTMIFTIAGVLLMAGAVTMIVVISRKRKAE